jgi:hypothetical protein
MSEEPQSDPSRSTGVDDFEHRLQALESKRRWEWPAVLALVLAVPAFILAAIQVGSWIQDQFDHPPAVRLALATARYKRAYFFENVYVVNATSGSIPMRSVDAGVLPLCAQRDAPRDKLNRVVLPAHETVQYFFTSRSSNPDGTLPKIDFVAISADGRSWKTVVQATHAAPGAGHPFVTSTKAWKARCGGGLRRRWQVRQIVIFYRANWRILRDKRHKMYA